MKKIGRIILIDCTDRGTLFTKYLGKCTGITKEYIYVKRFAFWNKNEQIWKSYHNKNEEGGWYHRRCTFLTKKDLNPIYYALLYM
jgi:hypothetical protein